STVLVNANLFEANLSGCRLEDTDLNRAYLSHADLRNAKFIGTILEEADLSYANLSQVDLSDKNNDLRRIKLDNANLTQAILKDVDLQLISLVHADLTQANLQKANLSGANLAYAKLIGADLTNANLSNANLAGADLTDAKLDGANLSGTIYEHQSFAPNHVRLAASKNLIYWNNLRFRSPYEVKIAEALERAGVLYFPNSAARLTTVEGRKNQEPDFLVCCDTPKGFRWGILEVDGPSHTIKRRAEEQERERDFEHCGVRVYRFDWKRCDEQPDNVVREFIELLSKS
ncbi:MAG: pentapeptide repeat-containing protein, partial [Chroococcales cyanobacterium]